MEKLSNSLNTLNSVSQFIVYKLIDRKDSPGEKDKVPVHYLSGQNTNAHDPACWVSYSQAFTAAKLFGENFGVGFVFTKNDPYFFIDIDKCLQPDLNWSPVALELCQAFSGAAIEISQSGKGLHIFGKYSGELPPHKNKNIDLKLEFYTQGRFVALTQSSIMGNIDTDFSAILPAVISKYFSQSETLNIQDWTSSPRAEWNGPTDDNELLDRMLRCQSAAASFGGKASFADLFTNNYEVLARHYNNDDSSMDMALASHLAFWTGNDCERILNLMLQSKLIREKWDRPDYLRRTILNACGLTTTWLCDKTPQFLEIPVSVENSGHKPSLVTGATYLTLDQQLELFKGCTYVCDLHRVLVPGGDLLKSEQFRVMFGGYTFPMDLTNEKVTRNAWEAFTESQAFRAPRAISTCFKPDIAPGSITIINNVTLVNVWWPIPIKRIKGDLTFFLNHLKKVLPNERDRLILLCYMAAVVQYQGKKFQWAPLIQGVEGNGKTLFTRCLEYAVGKKYSHFPKASELTSKFNDWMVNKVFIGVEDIYVPDEQREVLEALKPMITRECQEIEGKGANKISLEVCCNFMLNSNHKEGIRKTRNNRIFAPFFTAQQSVDDLKRDGMDSEYFNNLYNWLFQQDGFAIVAEYLYTFKIPDEFNPATHCQRAPITSTTEDAIQQSLGSVEQEILEAIDQEIQGFRGGWISSIALDRLLEKLHASRRIPHYRRRELLQSLGYDLHPHLHHGRVNNSVLPDAGKPRLYIKKDHNLINLTIPADIAKAYQTAQINS